MHILEVLVLPAQDLLIKSLCISHQPSVLLVALTGGELAKADLVPREIVLGEGYGPVKLLDVRWSGELVVWVNLIRLYEILNLWSPIIGVVIVF